MCVWVCKHSRSRTSQNPLCTIFFGSGWWWWGVVLLCLIKDLFFCQTKHWKRRVDTPIFLPSKAQNASTQNGTFPVFITEVEGGAMMFFPISAKRFFFPSHLQQAEGFRKKMRFLGRGREQKKKSCTCQDQKLMAFSTLAITIIRHVDVEKKSEVLKLR